MHKKCPKIETTPKIQIIGIVILRAISVKILKFQRFFQNRSILYICILKFTPIF